VSQVPWWAWLLIGLGLGLAVVAVPVVIWLVRFLCDLDDATGWDGWGRKQ
jgi:hypothetical protein